MKTFEKIVQPIIFLLLLIFLVISPIQAENLISTHFIDVGQGDSVLIELPNNKNMLIDAGPNSSGDKVVDYIKKNGIDTINYLIGTHPHADHIGGLDDVIESFKIGKIYLPQVNHTTKTYEDVLLAIDAKDKKIQAAKKGLMILENKNLKAEILSPIYDDYQDLNNWSVVVKVDYKDISFLFTGDAEKRVERQLINSEVNLESEVYKVAHHGSETSNTAKFLANVKPQVSVISVGKDNNYGHPSRVVINKLKKINSYILRTDIQSNIIVSSNGKNIDYNKNPVHRESNSKQKNKNEEINKNKDNKMKIINVDLEKEIVKMKNKSSKKIDISNWRLLSVKGEQEFYFPEGTVVKPGEIIKVASGRNAEKDSETIFWTGAYIWNNNGDSAKLFNSNNETVSTY